MASGPRALLLINRHSRRGGGAAAIAAALEAAGVRVDAQQPGDRDQARRLVLERRDMVDLVIVAGGDGTVNAVAEALLETGLPLGIVPLGTGNDLARTLGIPLDPAAAAAVIGAGATRRIDVGVVNGHPFFNAATIGLSNAAAQRLTGAVKRRWGPLGYVLTLWDAWRVTHPVAVELDLDGRAERRRSVQLVIGNGRHHGAGMTVAASARIDDHRLDVYSLDPQPWWQAISHVPALRLGRDEAAPGLWRGRAQRVVVTTDTPLRVRTDGEPTTVTPATFEVLPAAVEVIVPPTGS
jgi:YegS/Rv2252/BmrU family lipid kinase